MNYDRKDIITGLIFIIIFCLIVVFAVLLPHTAFSFLKWIGIIIGVIAGFVLLGIVLYYCGMGILNLFGWIGDKIRRIF